MHVEILREQERVKYEWLNKNTDYGRSFHAKGRVEPIKQLLDLHGVESLMDIGTGRGLFCRWVENNTNIKQIYGLDIAMDPVQFVRQSDRITFIKSGAHNIPLDEKVDCVTSFDFFEHVVTDDVDIILDEMARVCGKLMIHKAHYTTPEHPGYSTSHRKVVGELHQTLRPVDWWLAKFNRYGDASFKEKNRLFVIRI